MAVYQADAMPEPKAPGISHDLGAAVERLSMLNGRLATLGDRLAGSRPEAVNAKPSGGEIGSPVIRSQVNDVTRAISRAEDLVSRIEQSL